MSGPVIPPKDVVLVVDDEMEVRRAVTLALSEAGFTAEIAENGKQGLGLFLQKQERICLVISDVVMPVLDGIRMAEKIAEIDPNVKILFMTSYSEAELRVLARTRYPLVRKPLLPADLTAAIERLLATGDTQSAGQS